MSREVTILDAMADPALFSEWFDRGDWGAWRAFLATLFALSMNPKQSEVYRACTGRREPPEAAFSEAWLIVGRRGGKSLVMALVAVFLACFKDYREHLAPGEVGTVALIACDRKQARTLIRYIEGFLQVPMLQSLVKRQTTESFELTNCVAIEVHTASFRSIRGYTMAAAICDEVAFWHSDGSATPDYEILAALRPAMASIPGAVLICASSPHAKRGELYNAYKRYHGRDDAEVLTWQAATRTMNPSIPAKVIDLAYERDADRARAEYGAEFRSDLETFLTREVVDRAVRTEPLELARDTAHKYYAFTDPAGGGADEFTLGIGHTENKITIVDVVRASKGVPAEIVADYAAMLKTYGIHKVAGDKYAGSWPADEFARHDITYLPADKSKSGLYLDLLPTLNSGRIELPPDDRLVTQLVTLERRTVRGGRDSIDHPPGGHDDRANVVAGLVGCTVNRSRYTLEFVS